MNRARARIKVLIDKIGIDAFREQVEEELKGDWVAERDFDPEAAAVPASTRRPTRPSCPLPQHGSPNGDRPRVRPLRRGQRRAQRQEGFSTVQVKVYRGDLTPEQFRGLAQIMRDYCGGYARTTVRAEPGAALGARRVASTTSGSGSASSASATPAPTRSPTT